MDGSSRKNKTVLKEVLCHDFGSFMFKISLLQTIYVLKVVLIIICAASFCLRSHPNLLGWMGIEFSVGIIVLPLILSFSIRI